MKRTFLIATAAFVLIIAVAAGTLLIGRFTRLIPVGDVKIDPESEINPEREYTLILWEHEVPLPWETGAHRQVLEEAVLEFESVWPNVKVDLQVFDWYEDHARLREAIEKGQPPDVYGMPMDVRLIDANWQIPVGPYQSEASRDDMMDAAITAVSDGNGMWAWPRWIRTMVWVAREDLTDDLTRGRSYWTGDEFIDVLKGAVNASGAGLVVNAFDPDLFTEMMVASTGRHLINSDGRPAWSEEELARGLAFFQELISMGLTDRDLDSMSRHRLARFWSQKAAIIAPVNSWLLRHLLVRGGVLDVEDDSSQAMRHLTVAIPPPDVLSDGQPAHPAVVAGYAVFRQNPYQGDDHTKAAMALAEHLSRRMGPWEAAHLFAVPAHPSSWEWWRADSGLPEKELNLLSEWASQAVVPPLEDTHALIQTKVYEQVIPQEFVRLWNGDDPEAIAARIMRQIDGMRASAVQTTFRP